MKKLTKFTVSIDTNQADIQQWMEIYHFNTSACLLVNRG